MPYLIMCRKTHKILATYQNEKTLETMNSEKCYSVPIVEHKENTINSKKTANKTSGLGSKSHESKSKSRHSDSNSMNDHLLMSSYYQSSHSYSGCSSSSSESSYSDSSSSCDSGSF